MKVFIITLLSFLSSANSAKLFIEPGVFLNMLDSASAEYNNGTTSFNGAMRNDGLSYAIKFGGHFGHWELGVESELYNLAGHFESKTGDFSKEATITYNSLFLGYQFIPNNYLYFSVSGRPYMRANGDSFTESHNILSLEYSNHIKKWVSLNVKVETPSEFHNKSLNQTYSFKELLLVGFSFPLISD